MEPSELLRLKGSSNMHFLPLFAPSLRRAWALLAIASFLAMLQSPGTASAADRPNILVIITDDQGYGDLGVHDNPKIKTPNLDQFARQSVRLKSFFVSPVCAPTRASLLTGRYNYRTGVVDTYQGRAMMHPDEVTLAEMLTKAGYRTGIFGKWHLGDNAPLRPIDQGFREALVVKGGGIGQPSDPPGGTSYFDPVLQHNGKEERYKGYCSDIFAQAAIDFLSKPGAQPFFAYLAFNCPHEPLEAPEPELAQYRALNLALSQFPQLGQPVPASFAAPQEMVARAYAMISNIDANVGRVLKALDDRGLSSNTIVVFLTDNGPAFVRFNDGLRGWKGSVYDGGIRVPCYIRWPGQFPPGHVVDRIAAHIDLVPTLLDACGLPSPSGVKLDGRSLFRSCGAFPLPAGPIGRSIFSGTAATGPSPAGPSPREYSSTNCFVPSRLPERASLRLWNFMTWSTTPTSFTASPPSTPTSRDGCTTVILPGSRMSRRPAALIQFGSSWGARARTRRS